MSHEKSITQKFKGGFFNIPTVTMKGEHLTPEEAIRRFGIGKLRSLGGPFATIEEAIRNAKKRSERGHTGKGGTPSRNPFKFKSSSGF